MAALPGSGHPARYLEVADSRSRTFPYQSLVGLALFLITLSAIFRVTHHADELAEMLGEPYGTLILTLSASIIEVAIMITVLGHSESNSTFVRDTIAATVMITVGLMLGLAMFIGAFVHRQQTVNTEGAMTYLRLADPAGDIDARSCPTLPDTSTGPTLAVAQEIYISVGRHRPLRHLPLYPDTSAPAAVQRSCRAGTADL